MIEKLSNPLSFSNTLSTRCYRKNKFVTSQLHLTMHQRDNHTQREKSPSGNRAKIAHCFITLVSKPPRSHVHFFLFCSSLASSHVPERVLSFFFPIPRCVQSRDALEEFSLFYVSSQAITSSSDLLSTNGLVMRIHGNEYYLIDTIDQHFNGQKILLNCNHVLA